MKAINTGRGSMFLSWGFMIAAIELFFVIAAMTGSYIAVTLFMGMSFLAALGFFFFTRHQRITVSFFEIALLIFMVFLSVRALLSGGSRLKTDLIFYWSAYFIMSISVTFYAYRIAEKFFDMLAWLGVLFGVGVVLQMLFTDLFTHYYFALFSGEYKESVVRQVIMNKMYTGWTSQTFATCLNLAIGFFAAFINYEHTKKRKYVYILVFLTISFLLTGKRGPLIFLVLGLALVNLLLSNNMMKLLSKYGVYFILVLILGAAAVYYFKTHDSVGRNSIVRFMEMLNGGGGSEDVSNGRFALWGLSVKLFAENPVFGVGWRCFHQYAALRLNEDIEGHNVYLQLLAETGFIGLILYLIPVIYCMSDTRKQCKRAMQAMAPESARLLKFSYYLQMYLFLYAVTSNTLYDYCTELTYFLAFAMYVSGKAYIQSNQKEALLELSWIK